MGIAAPLDVPPRQEPSALYFVSAPVDGAVMGGLSMAAAALWWWQPADLGAWPFALAVLCNWPHFAATSVRLYGRPENARQFPATAWLVPLVVLAGAAASLASPTRIAPFYIKLMLLWSPYHFSGQTLGLSLGYARRAGLHVSSFQRSVVDAFLVVSYLAYTAHLETGPGVRTYIGVDHPKLDLPSWVTPSLDVTAALLASAALVAWLRPRTDRSTVPWIVLLPAAAQGTWFVLGRGIEAFQLLVPFFHSLQYLFVAWAVHLRERIADGHAPSVEFVARASVRWIVLNVGLGIALFVGSPYALAAFGFELGLTMAVMAAAVQLHHFFVDGVIWKLRNPRLASPLLVRVQECATPSRPTAEAA